MNGGNFWPEASFVRVPPCPDHWCERLDRYLAQAGLRSRWEILPVFPFQGNDRVLAQLCVDHLVIYEERGSTAEDAMQHVAWLLVQYLNTPRDYLICLDEQLAGACTNLYGYVNECLVRQALSLAPAARPHWFRSVRLGNSREDAYGADIVVDTDAGPLWLQVKSSVQQKHKFRNEGKDRTGLGIIVVRDGESKSSLALRCLCILRELYEQLYVC